MGGFDEYDVLGHHVLVGTTEPTARTAIHQLLRGFVSSPTPARDLPRYELSLVGETWYVHGDAGPLHADRNVFGALGMLEWHLMSAALERHSGLFHLHGAALAAPGAALAAQGMTGAVVLAGKSGSGKSTLTLALMQRGFLPFADDVALVEPTTLDVRTFRRAFHMSNDSLRRVEAMTGEAVQSGGDQPAGFFYPRHWAPSAVPVRWLLLLELEPERSPCLTRLTPADAAVAVLEHSLNLHQASRLGLATVARLTADAECYRFQHGKWPESLAIVERLARSR